MRLCKTPGEQSVPRHREEDPRLAKLENEEHRRMSDNGAERHDADEQITPSCDPGVLQRQRQRLRLLRGKYANEDE